MAKKEKEKKDKKGKKKKEISFALMFFRMLAIVIFGFLLFAFKESTLLLATGMLPTLVAFVVDKTKGNYAAKTVGYMNFLGVLIIQDKIFTVAGRNWWDLSLSVMQDPLNWVIMYSAAALGWCLFFLMPHIANWYLSMAQERDLAKNVKYRIKLIKQWGEEVKLGPKVLKERDAEVSGTSSFIRNGSISKGQKKFINTISRDTEHAKRFRKL